MLRPWGVARTGKGLLSGNTGCVCAQTARRLALEWQAWVVRTSALRRAFVSVKGFYFQADVLGQPVTWLVPHALAQVLPAVKPYPENNPKPFSVLGRRAGPAGHVAERVACLWACMPESKSSYGGKTR